MEANVPLQAEKHKKINYIIISLLTFILIMCVVIAQLIYTVLQKDGIYNGVYIEDINVSNMSVIEAKEALTSAFQDKIGSLSVTLRTNSASMVIDFSDLDMSYDIDGAIDKAYSVGRTGNIIQRLFDIYKTARNGIHCTLPVTYDNDKLDEAINSFYDKTFLSVKQFDLSILKDKVTIRSGHHGENIDKENLKKEIENSINQAEEKIIEVPVIITQPNKIDIDELYNRIVSEPVNAAVTVEDNEVKIAPHEKGRQIDRKVLSELVSQLEGTEGKELVLPVTFVEPEITKEYAEKVVFRDELSTASTWFSTSNENNRNRGENIKLASEKISGKILGPGEVFSFNEVVGPRTAEGGYKAAHTYVGNKVIDDIGGGICQVSSTLYNAVLFADLEVVARTNHIFTVGYVPKGSDAAVNYNTLDFQFKNSTRWPIKIEAKIINNNTIKFTLIGTNETPGKEIIISPKIIKTMDYTVRYVNDPTLPAGTTKIKQEGMTGYVVDTYKIVKQDGKIVSQKKIHTSTYKPLEQIVLKGPDLPEKAVEEQNSIDTGVVE